MSPRRNLPRRLKTLAVLVALAALSACTQAPVATPIGGNLDVLGPTQYFSQTLRRGALPPDWFLIGKVPAETFSVHMLDGLPALRVRAGVNSFALMRRTNASLLAMPYLSWAWQASPPKAGAHPIRLIVGLADRTKAPDTPWWQVGGTDTPQVNRMITVVWNETALGRGSVVGPERVEGRPEMARYVARGGSEQGGRWWVDTVDLSLIHRQVWPGDDPANMEIRLIGIAALPALVPAEMDVATVRLTR